MHFILPFHIRLKLIGIFLFFVLGTLHSHAVSKLRIRFIWVTDTAGVKSKKLIFLKVEHDTLFAIADSGLKKKKAPPIVIKIIKYPLAQIASVQYIRPYGPMPYIGLTFAASITAGVVYGESIRQVIYNGYFLTIDQQSAPGCFGCIGGLASIPIGMLLGLFRPTMHINGDSEQLLLLAKKLRPIMI